MDAAKVLISNVSTSRYLVVTYPSIPKGEAKEVLAGKQAQFPTDDAFYAAALWYKIQREDNAFCFKHVQTGAYLWISTDPDGRNYAAAYCLGDGDPESAYKVFLDQGVQPPGGDTQIISITEGPGYVLGVTEYTGFVRPKWLFADQKTACCDFRFSLPQTLQRQG